MAAAVEANRATSRAGARFVDSADARSGEIKAASSDLRPFILQGRGVWVTPVVSRVSRCGAARSSRTRCRRRQRGHMDRGGEAVSLLSRVAERIY
jgi:hypothetical protein